MNDLFIGLIFILASIVCFVVLIRYPQKRRTGALINVRAVVALLMSFALGLIYLYKYFTQ